MANTSSRALRLLALLQTHRHWSGSELADRLDVSARTLRRDVDRLRELGYPVEATPGVDGGYQLAPGASLPPLTVDDDEAVALAVGMQAAASGSAAGLEDAALRALTKVVQVMPPRLRSRVEALRAATVPAGVGTSDAGLDPGVLVAVAQACRDTVRLRFAYTARAAERTERYVEPLRLVALGRRWYLVAYDLGRHDWRTFRLDRLTEPTATTESFRPRELPAPDAADFVRASISDFPGTQRVVALVHAPAAEVAGRVGRWAKAEPAGDDAPDRCRLTMSAESPEWAVFTLGITGAPFEILEPAEVRAVAADWGARLTTSAGRP